jgi:DNA-binding NarL/FixJ family response regulator
MSTRQVFVIWTHPLFRESLSLLLHHPQIELVGETCDYVTASQEIEKLRPDTLLIEETEGNPARELINEIKQQPWEMRILFMNLMDNQLNFFHHELRTVGKAEDLVQMILR